MMTIEQISIALTHTRIKNLSQEIDVSPYHLRKLKQGSGDVPYSKIKAVSDYFEGSRAQGK